MNFPITKELLFACFNGQATALQKQLIDEWARQPENEEFFYTCLVEWELTHPQYQADVTKAIDQYREFVANHTSKPASLVPETLELKSRHLLLFQWYLAASLVALLGISWLFRAELLNRTYATEAGEVRTWTLADGSRVTLNANSSLRVPRFGFGRAWSGSPTREVFLEGEGEFSVIHTQDHRQFVVKTANPLDVRVLGTEFTVYSRDSRMRVVLNQGKVQLRNPADESARTIDLVPGDVITLEHQKVQRKHVEDPKQYSAWKDHLFVFNATPLSQVAKMLQENYGLKVTIAEPEIAQETVSGSFKATSADELLKSISKALDIQATRRGKTVLFSANP